MNPRIFISGVTHSSSIYLAQSLQANNVLVGGSYLINSYLPDSLLPTFENLIKSCSLISINKLSKPYGSRRNELMNSDEIYCKRRLSSIKYTKIINRVLDSMVAREWNDNSDSGPLLNNANLYLRQAINLIESYKFDTIFFIDIPHDPWEIAFSEYATLLDIKVICPINIGLMHIYILTKYPNFHQPVLKDKSNNANHFVIDSVENYLKDFNVNVSYSTHHIKANNNYFSLVIFLPLYAVINNILFYFKTGFNNYFGSWKDMESLPKRNRNKSYVYSMAAKIYRSFYHYGLIFRYQKIAYKNYIQLKNSKEKKIIALLQTRPEATQFPLSNHVDMYYTLNKEGEKLSNITGLPIYFKEHPNMLAPGRLFCSKDIYNDKFNNKLLPMGVSVESLANQGDTLLVNTTTTGVEQSRLGKVVITVAKPWWLGLPNTIDMDTYISNYNIHTNTSNPDNWNDSYRLKSKNFIYLPWFQVNTKKHKDLISANSLNIEQIEAIKSFARVLIEQ
jgi:hypothetical protein